MRVLLADDHQILRDGIRRGLEAAGETVVGEADNGEEAVELVRSTTPDIVLMDLSMPVLDGVSATRRIAEEFPQVKVVVLTMHDDPQRTRAALALLQARGVNLLVLDEPTNHLDLPAIEQLEQAMESFDGTVLLVTHDRRMLDTVRLTRRWHVEEGRVTEVAPG